MDAALYASTLLTLAAIYAALSLGLNLQWGLTGLMNFGGLAFVAAGAYTAALLTAAPSATHLGGFGVPWWLAWPAGAAVEALLALPVGAVSLRVRTDYLAIATIGIAEIVRLVVRNEDWLTGGPLGISGIPRPFESLGQPWGVQLGAGFSRDRAMAMYARALKRFETVLAGKDPGIQSSVLRTRGRAVFYQVRIGTDTRAAANELCNSLRKAGGACLVLRNKG